MEDKKRPGRPRKDDHWSAEILLERSNRYFQKCDSRTKPVVTKDGVEYIPNPIPYSIEGLCDYLDITRRTFYNWRQRDDDLGLRAQKIHNKVTANRITGALDGTQNHAFAQFLLKNNNPEDYKEKIEVENSVAAEAVSMFSEWASMWKSFNQGDDSCE